MTPGAAKLTAKDVQVPPGHLLARLPTVFALIGAVFLVASVVGWATGDEATKAQFFFSWLVAFMFFLSLALGGLIFVLIQHAARAGWSILVRRIAENFMGTLPVFAVLSLPIFLGMGHLYHWTDAEHAAHDPLLAAKAPYLNQGFFLVRAVLYFAAWSFLAWWFRSRSVEQDATGDQTISLRLRKWAGPAIVAFAFTTTFAVFDWLMSLEPHWYSTIYGGYFFAGSMVAVLSAMIVVSLKLQAAGFLGDEITAEHYHDLGKLLFAFTVFWAYIAFSQFMLIWYGNIPEETVWYEQRFTGSWMTMSKTLLVGHFVVPFFFLMPRTVKRVRPAILLGALYMLAMHYLDIHWLAMPTLHREGVDFAWLDVTCFLAVGGFTCAAFCRLTSRDALVPVKDPRLPESLAFQNF